MPLPSRTTCVEPLGLETYHRQFKCTGHEPLTYVNGAGSSSTAVNAPDSVLPNLKSYLHSAVEKGLPLIGNAHKMGKELFPPLFKKHGTAFMINMGPLGGWNLALSQASDIFDCLSRADDFEVSVPGTFLLRASP